MRYVGEASGRPDPSTVTPEEWRSYLYLKANPAGTTKETWYCRGCRRFFVAERDTVTNHFVSAFPPARQRREGTT